MSHYIANLRDIEFTLFDLLKRDEILEKGPFAEVDRATAMGMLEEVKRLSEVDLAASFVESDRLGVDFNPATGDAKLPESFKKSYRAYMDGELMHQLNLAAPSFHLQFGGRLPKWFLAQIHQFTSMHQELRSHMLHTC